MKCVFIYVATLTVVENWPSTSLLCAPRVLNDLVFDISNVVFDIIEGK